MLVAAIDNQVVWAILPVLSPGKTMLLLTPGAFPQNPAIDVQPIVHELIRTLCDAYRNQIHLVQTLLPTGDSAVVAAFQASGFLLLGELIYLQRRVSVDVPIDWPAGLELRRYSPQTHALFAQTIRQTYEKSQDCPALNGMRDIEDVLAGHKATGDFDPEFWFVLAREGQGLGVLLLNPLHNQNAMELVYLGLTPEARGQGHGDALLRQALHCVRRAGRSDLTLAVDAGNAPALRLYHRQGLRQIGARIALVRNLRQSATA
jgi:ribosomal protein S18 acetylase RimI-like enzyme